MTNFCCEVIGCPRPAHWRRSVLDASEEFLCNHHWGVLHVCSSGKALFYVPFHLENTEAANRESLAVTSSEMDGEPQSTMIF